MRPIDLSIVFNGEIYNYLDLRDILTSKGHKFSTQSDTEVVLAAYTEWGADCLAHLNGMFAIRSLRRKPEASVSSPATARAKSRFSIQRQGTTRYASPRN